jgi:type I restriction enzyme S subunit
VAVTHEEKALVDSRKWRNCTFVDLCRLQRGFDITEATKKNGLVPVYSSSGVSYFHSEVGLLPPAVITGRKGLLGKVFYVEEPCWPHDTTLWVKDFRGNDPKFVYWFLSGFRLERFDAATSVPTLNRNNLTEISISLPPLAEQRAIAAALSDVDALLGALDQFVAKKRDIKQAAMQQLLTGQTRLPGFGGKWETKRLGDLLAYEQPTKYLVRSSEYSEYGGVPVLTAGKTFVLGHTNESDGVFCDVPVIIFDDFTTATKFVNFSFKVKSSALKVLKLCDESANLRFVFERMQLIRYLVGDHKRHWISEFRKIEIPTPSSDEQTAIATVLSDMDAELAALEQRRDKTRLLKQGMMQELLTGRTRLV